MKVSASEKLYAPKLTTSLFDRVENTAEKEENAGLTKLKVSASEKLYVPKLTMSLFDRVENTAEKGENAGYQHFLLFPQCSAVLSF